MILAALYLLWAYQRVFHGEPDEREQVVPRADLREGRGAAAVRRRSIVFSGVYPKPMLDRIEPSVDELIAHVEDHTDFDVEDAHRRRGRRTQKPDRKRSTAR